jgi:hypothetical protein
MFLVQLLFLVCTALLSTDKVVVICYSDIALDLYSGRDGGRWFGTLTAHLLN